MDLRAAARGCNPLLPRKPMKNQKALYLLVKIELLHSMLNMSKNLHTILPKIYHRHQKSTILVPAKRTLSNTKSKVKKR
jgi:hypothetical protein